VKHQILSIALFLFLLVVEACTSSSKKMPLIVNNSTTLNLSNIENFSCKAYLSDNLYSDPETRVLSVDKDAIFINQHSDGSKEVWFGVLTVKPHPNDSLWMNIEVFRIRKQSDTLRIANFGGKAIPNDSSVINNIKNVLCKFLNK